MQAVNANGVMVYIATQPVGTAQDKHIAYRDMRNGLAKKLIVLGSAQIIFGVLSIVLESIKQKVYLDQGGGIFSFAFMKLGFCMGAIFIVTGSFGIVGGIRRIRWSVITFNIVSVVSASLAALLIIVCTSAAVEGFRQYEEYQARRHSNIYYRRENTDPYSKAQETVSMMEALLAAVAVLEGMAAIYSSVVCCTIGACCCDCEGGCCCPTDCATSEIMMTDQEFDSPQFAKPNMSHQPQTVMVANQQQNFYQTHANCQNSTEGNRIECTGNYLTATERLARC